jgi:transposase-like protein
MGASPPAAEKAPVIACGEIDDKVQTFLNRPLEGDWPYVWLDATYVKVREAGRIVSVAVIIAVGVNGDESAQLIEFVEFGQNSAESSGSAVFDVLDARRQFPLASLFLDPPLLRFPPEALFCFCSGENH